MRNTRQEIERRMRIMAKAKVDMLQGTYPWPDGRLPIKPDGTPRVSDQELLRIAGYSKDYRDPKGHLFSDPYFLKEMRLELSRREKRTGLVLRVEPERLKRISTLLFDELENRLTNDPASFTNAQLLAATKEYYQSAKEAEDSFDYPDRVSDKMSQFNSFISKNLVLMSGEEQERLQTSVNDAGKLRTDELQRMIDASNELSQEQDDSDIIDAEISTVPE